MKRNFRFIVVLLFLFLHYSKNNMSITKRKITHIYDIPFSVILRITVLGWLIAIFLPSLMIIDTFPITSSTFVISIH